ncbi:cysteine-rich DPF motif domain-containing protein 1 isoform X2 [Anolis carolinensis]|uniref:cysteine-rich DPF motif domain-containing protein 1 isoform X2 n=1 Tax=Anolis carolinensis TaxID=28377 RepID=UPI002F2B35AF
MESKRKIQHQGTFECELCGLTAPYSYFGQKPPNAYSAVLLEECYVMTDPFTSDKDKFLILGSQCSLCHKCVCTGTDCSLFYSKRFCLPCVNLHIQEFPSEIKQDLKKKTHSPSSKKRDSDHSKKPVARKRKSGELKTKKKWSFEHLESTVFTINLYEVCVNHINATREFLTCQKIMATSS